MSSVSRNLIWLLLVLALAAVTVTISSSGPTKDAQREFPSITVQYEDEELVFILKDVAKQMGVIVVLGPSVGGTASAQASDEDWDSVLSNLLRSRGFDFGIAENLSLGRALVVAAPEKLQEVCDDFRDTRACSFPIGNYPEDGVRAEFLFEFASADSWMDFLKNEYNRVRFEPHPVLNGFFATGSREDLDLIRKDVANIDKQENSGPSPTQLRP